MIDWIILIVTLLFVGLAAKSLFKTAKSGKCAGCSAAGHCSHQNGEHSCS